MPSERHCPPTNRVIEIRGSRYLAPPLVQQHEGSRKMRKRHIVSVVVVVNERAVRF